MGIEHQRTVRTGPRVLAAQLDSLLCPLTTGAGDDLLLKRQPFSHLLH